MYRVARLSLAVRTTTFSIKPAEDGKVLRIIPNGQLFLAVCLPLTKQQQFRIFVFSSWRFSFFKCRFPPGSKHVSEKLNSFLLFPEKVFTIRRCRNRVSLLSLLYEQQKWRHRFSASLLRGTWGLALNIADT